MSLTVGGRYRRKERIAEGGSSSVHRAVELETGREVALKAFHVHRAYDAELLPALERAQALAARLGDTVLPPLLEVGADDDGAPFVVMPLLDGETLGAVLERGPLSTRQAVDVGARVLRALDALHAAGATHGDLSPDNVLAARDGRVLLLDHESLGPIGAPRPERRTEGFGTSGGAREARDDLRALASLVRALAGAGPRPMTDAQIDEAAAALRGGRRSEALRALSLSPAARGPQLGVIALAITFALAVIAVVTGLLAR
jgi:serine/threonine protein kinase